MARIPVVAYCPDGAGLALLTETLRGSAQIKLEGAVQSAAGLAEPLLLAGEAVIVARLEEIDNELPEVIAHSEGFPLVLLTPNARRIAVRALRAGAGAVLNVDASAERVGAAVLSVHYGLVAMPGGVVDLVAPPGPLAASPEPLTPREIEILGLLAGGDSNKTIAARLSISVHTVKFHISSILAKLGVGSRTEAVAVALRLGRIVL